jgi:peroxin-14
MAEQIRNDLVNNAVSFLTDSSVNDTPLAKKIQFLESKGMSNAEIQHALSLAQQQPISSTASISLPQSSPSPPLTMQQGQGQGQSLTSNPGIYPYYTPLPPPAPRSYDWKDYVIMGTTTAGFIYGAYQVVSRYVLPKIIPPSQSKLDDDKDAMEREFQRVEAILKKLEIDQIEFIKRQDEKSKLIDDALIEVDAIVKATNEKNLRNEETLKYLKLEIDSIKTTLLNNLESQKSTISNELQELEKKTDSLKKSVDEFKLNNNSNSTNATATTNNYNDNSKSLDLSNIPTPSSTPPANLLTNNRSTSNTKISTTEGTPYSSLNIPPPSSVPSAKDILGSDYNTTATTTATTNTASKIDESSNSNIPAWQLASSQKTNINNNSNGAIPAWQLAAQDN